MPWWYQIIARVIILNNDGLSSMKSSQIRFDNFTQMLNMPITNKRDGKRRNTLGCLDQYMYVDTVKQSGRETV